MVFQVMTFRKLILLFLIRTCVVSHDFKLASNYITFFEKLVKTLGRILEVLPQYEQVAEMLAEKPSERLKSSVCKVYIDLLKFCQGVARVFTKKDGSKSIECPIQTTD